MKASLISKYGSLANVPEAHMPRTIPGTLPTKAKQEEEASDEDSWGSNWKGAAQPVEASNEEDSWGPDWKGAAQPVAGPVAC